MLNKIIVMGRLTRDPELRRTQSGLSVTSFSVACDRDFKSQSGEKETDFIDIVAWRQTAEFVCKYYSKGRMAVVEGRLQIRDWQDNNGNKRRSAEIVADNIYFGDSKRDGDGGGYPQGSYAPQGGYPSRGRATVRRAAPPMARPPEAILRRITAVTLRKSVRTTASFRSDMVARETGRQPTEGGENYGELSEYQHGLLDGQQGRR